MKHIQTFAGHELKEQDLQELENKIFSELLVGIITNKNRDGFITPEQFMVKHRARAGQVRAVLRKMVRKGLLKHPVERKLDSGRIQSYYYFNMTSHQATSYAKRIVSKPVHQ